MRIPERFYGRLSAGASTSRVCDFCVGTSPIRNPDSVAVFLARVFPALSDSGLVDFSEYEEWPQVQAYLCGLYQIRRDERLRAERESQEKEDEEWAGY